MFNISHVGNTGVIRTQDVYKQGANDDLQSNLRNSNIIEEILRLPLKLNSSKSVCLQCISIALH